MNDMYNFINKLNIKSEYVIAAISGGPDSMFLLDTLITMRDRLNIKIVCAHVHHNLRKESDEEAVYVKKYCEENNVIFEMMKIEKYPNNKFSEEAARKIRYEYFDKLVKKYNSDILFTAHHGDDLMETILMRITRGSNLKGYAGFETISRDRGYIIARPLVYLTKAQIIQYLDNKNIWYALDMSNNDEFYTRNRYRKNVLPLLKKENPNVHYKFSEFNKKIIMAHEYLKKETDNIYSDIIKDNKIIISKFNKLDDIIKLYLLETYLKNIYNEDIIYINDIHKENIITLIKDSNSASINLPLNKKVIIEYDKLWIKENTISKDYEYTFEVEITLPNGKKIYIDNETNDTNNFVIHLNSSEITLPFHVRNRRNGDRMTVKNMLGSKKINDIFTDSKISKELRDNYPLVTDDTGEIIWIPGIKKSHLDRKKEQKYDIILKYN